jgi:hypothetical protein
VTPVVALPVTDAEKSWLWLPVSVNEAGVTTTLTVGTSEIVADADFVGSAMLIAVTVTVSGEPIIAGAV